MSEVNKFIMNVNNQNLLIENSGPLPVTDSNEVEGGLLLELELKETKFL